MNKEINRDALNIIYCNRFMDNVLMYNETDNYCRFKNRDPGQ